MAINVLSIHGISEIGGAETKLLNILTFLDREKFSPIVVCLKTGTLVSELKAIHIPTVEAVLPSWRKIRHFWKVPSSVCRLVQ